MDLLSGIYGAPHPARYREGEPAVSTTPSDHPGPVQADDDILAISHAEMNAACRRGDAVFLSRTIQWLMRYRDAWWVVFEHGWLRIHDDLIESDLERAVLRLQAAEDIVGDAQREQGSG